MKALCKRPQRQHSKQGKESQIRTSVSAPDPVIQHFKNFNYMDISKIKGTRAETPETITRRKNIPLRHMLQHPATGTNKPKSPNTKLTIEGACTVTLQTKKKKKLKAAECDIYT